MQQRLAMSECGAAAGGSSSVPAVRLVSFLLALLHLRLGQQDMSLLQAGLPGFCAIAGVAPSALLTSSSATRLHV